MDSERRMVVLSWIPAVLLQVQVVTEFFAIYKPGFEQFVRPRQLLIGSLAVVAVTWAAYVTFSDQGHWTRRSQLAGCAMVAASVLSYLGMLRILG